MGLYKNVKGDASRIIGLDFVDVTKHRSYRNARSIFKRVFITAGRLRFPSNEHGV